MPFIRLLIIVAINLALFSSVFLILFEFFFQYPEFLIIGYDFIILNALFIGLAPSIILFQITPRSLKDIVLQKKFRGVRTFEDFVEKLFILNLYKYRVENHKRLISELKIFLNP